jgi:Mg2+ and Co2+ transporter CorA
MLVSEQENSLIEQLRSFGVSIEDLEALTGEENAPVEHVVESAPPAEVAGETLAPAPAQTGSPAAFQPLVPETMAATVREDTSLKQDTAGLRQQAALFDANQTRDRILAEAKDAAAEIRANAVRLVSVKLQAAEDEIMTMRAKATEEVAQLRMETSKALAARLQEAGSEALALREAARQETLVFWESASREFSDARERISQMHAHMVQLLESVNDAVASLEEAASSIAALCESHLEPPSRREEPE